MKNLIITLVSDQAAPNVQFIKEKQNENSDLLFVSTLAMEEKGVRRWIEDACQSSQKKTKTVVVNEFSIKDIYEKLDTTSDYHIYEQLYINVTGGTKIMSLAVYEYFRQYSSKIYYLTGRDNNMLQIHPKTSQIEIPITKPIKLDEYIRSYGFTIKEGNLSEITYKYTSSFFDYYVNKRLDNNILIALRELRAKGKKKARIEEISGLRDLLVDCNFPLQNENEITRAEIKYMTGDWFEEYIYYRLSNELKIPQENLKTGTTLSKNDISNEFDVIFLYNNTLYTIECKTSVMNENLNILQETIYKADSLKSKLGLFTSANIFTLSSKENKEIRNAHLQRADSTNIGLFCKEDILNCQSLTKLLKI